MKGQAAVVIIVLVVIAVAAFVIIPQLGINFPSGGIPVQTVKYSNNVISIDDFSISDRAPFSGKDISSTGSVTITFSVTNNGDEKVDTVLVKFDDLPNIEKIKLQCPGLEPKEGIFSCVINELESLDSKRIQAELFVRPGIVNEIQSSAIKYSVSYVLEGSIEAKIPIVEDLIFLPKDAKFQAGIPTYGPIQVTIKPPVGRERKVGSQTVIDNFAYKGLPFNLELSVKDVGSFKKDDVFLVQWRVDPSEFKVIRGFKLELENLEATFCDRLDKTILTLKQEKEKVPFDVSCTLKSTASPENYLIGVVRVKYKYDYKLVNSEALTIRPSK